MRDGWTKTSLGDVTHIRQGKTLGEIDMAGGTHPVFGANGVIGWHDSGHYDHPVIALGCRGSCGTVRLAPPGAWLGNNVMAVWPKDETQLSLAFLQLLLEALDLRASGAITGQVQPQITRSSLSPVGVLVPTRTRQRRIVDLIASVSRAAKLAQPEQTLTRAAESILGQIVKEASVFVPLAECTSFAKAGGTPRRSQPANFGGDIPWLKSGEVGADMISSTEESISQVGLESSSAWLMPAGTVVVAMYGQGPTAGNVGFTAVPMSSNQAVLGLVANAALVEARFLFHWLRSRKASMRARRAGGPQPNLSKELVLDEPVPVLPLVRQRELASMLDQLSTTAIAARRIVPGLERLREGLMMELLSGAHEIPESYDPLLSEAASA